MCKLGEKLLPNKEAFEALGFKLSKPDGSQHYQGSIPEGWRMELSNPIGYLNFLDEHGRSRARYDYKEETVTLIPQKPEVVVI